jgi:glycosyltransferase involved in cell wall biosynthesis
MKPTVTHVISSLSTGGAERTLLALVRDSSEEFDHRVVVLSAHDSMRRQFESVTSGGVVTLGLPRGVRGMPGFMGAIREVLRRPSNIVHGWMHHGCVVATAAAAIQRRSKPCRLVWGVRNDDGSRVVRLTERLALWAGRRTSAHCDVMISNSRRALDSLLQRGFSPRRVVVIPNGVVVPTALQVATWRAEVRSELGISPDAPVAIYVGNLRAAKDPECLLRGIRTAVGHLPSLTVLLVGRAPVGAAAEPVLRAFRTLPCIRLMGETQDVMPLMSASDVLVLSSKSEGCPTVVLEALACGCGVVSTDVGDVREIIGSAGQVVEVGDGLALGTALVRAISQRGETKRDGLPSPRAQVLGRHEQDQSLSAMVHEYRRLLNTVM